MRKLAIFAAFALLAMAGATVALAGGGNDHGNTNGKGKGHCYRGHTDNGGKGGKDCGKGKGRKGDGGGCKWDCYPPPTTTTPPTETLPPPTRGPNNVFLCWSPDQWSNPGVWPETAADGLIAQGYFSPLAVPGNVDGGTNIGAYHLWCRSSLTKTGLFLGADGGIYDADVAGTNPGYYPIVG
jgi:hypothetical protein